MRIAQKGKWPGSLTLRQGWARAEVRPWNDELPDASIRLARGGAGFLRAAANHLTHIPVESVLSPPLSDSGTRVWRQAGFSNYLELDLYRHDLDGHLTEGDRPVAVSDNPPWEEAMALDRHAFQPLWRLGELGLMEAYRAVPRSAFLAARDPDDLAGYAVVGVTGSFGYLQRIAVHPRVQRQGFGRALVRESLRFIRAHGARSALLNTQPDNASAAALYEAEGFVRETRPLHILRTIRTGDPQ